jgi:hypothetical protein
MIGESAYETFKASDLGDIVGIKGVFLELKQMINH